MNEPITLQQALSEAQARLSAFASSRLDAELLLCEVLQCERSRLYTTADADLQVDVMEYYRTLVEQRKRGIPVAYLTGVREFWSLPLAVDENTLVPRPETECLVERVLTLVPGNAAMQIADPGTGCGAIAIAIAAERPACRITATDISALALAVAMNNARQHNLHNVQYRQGYWLEALDETFDMIVSNPPYIRSNDAHLQSAEIAHEPLLALDGGADGLESIRVIIQSAGGYLRPGGWLVIEHGYDQAAAVQRLFQDNAFTAIGTDRDYAGCERLTYGRAK